MINIRDLAEKLRLSVGTVSRALNGRPDVNADTRKRVIEAAAALGYVPNQSGRSLRMGATGIFGFFVNSNDVRARSSARFFMTVIDGVQTELARHDLDLVVFPGANSGQSIDHLERIARRQIVDGVIIAETAPDDPRIKYLMQMGVPFVAFGRSEVEGNYKWLDFDFEGAIEILVTRMFNNGHRRIGFSAYNADLNYLEVMTQAYQATLQKLGLPFRDEYIFNAEPSKLGGCEVYKKLIALDEPPTGLVCSHSFNAVGVYEAMQEMGRRPGIDLALSTLTIGEDLDRLEPSLTGVETDLCGLGAKLANLLMASLKQTARHVDVQEDHVLWPMTVLAAESDSMPPPHGK